MAAAAMTEIKQLLAAPGATDLLINGHRDAFLVTTLGPIRRVPLSFESEAQLGEFAQSVIAAGGRHLDAANPFADVALNNWRVHAALRSGCVDRTLLSIRVHAEREFRLGDLIGHSISSEQAEWLGELIRARKNFLISGATGSGKTTLLRAMLAEARDDRVIVLEDVAEINLSFENFIALQTRQSNIEGRGEINLDRLLRESLRMRPDRIAVGEVRGAELVTMLQALNTGHRGAGATIHANSLAQVADRLTAIALLFGMPEKVLAMQAVAAFDAYIHLANHRVVAVGVGRVSNGELVIDERG